MGRVPGLRRWRDPGRAPDLHAGRPRLERALPLPLQRFRARLRGLRHGRARRPLFHRADAMIGAAGCGTGAGDAAVPRDGHGPCGVGAAAQGAPCCTSRSASRPPRRRPAHVRRRRGRCCTRTRSATPTRRAAGAAGPHRSPLRATGTGSRSTPTGCGGRRRVSRIHPRLPRLLRRRRPRRCRATRLPAVPERIGRARHEPVPIAVDEATRWAPTPDLLDAVQPPVGRSTG